MAAADRRGRPQQEPGLRSKGLGGLGEEGRSRLMQAMADIRFDKYKWLFQFEKSGNSAMRRVLLAGAPANPPQPGIQGLELIRYLTQDPVYQLK